jgi:membrane dipeptidase
MPSADEGAVATAAERLHRDSLVWVIHDHFYHRLDANLAMRDGGVAAKTLVPVADLAIYNDSTDPDHAAFYARTLAQRDGWAVESLVRLERAQRLLESRPDRLVLALGPEDVLAARREGRSAVLLGLEGCKAFEGRLELLHVFHRLGVRQAQLMWAYPNQLVEASGSSLRLSSFGRECVAAMNELGIVIDLAHAPLDVFAETVRLSRRPVIVSHGAPTDPHPGSGDMTRAHLDALAASGGLLGLHFCRHYIDGPFATFESFLQTIDWMVEAGYERQIALGGDLFEVDDYFRARHPAPAGSTHQTWQPFIAELGEISRLPELTRALVARGYPEARIRAILGTNALRLYSAVMA